VIQTRLGFSGVPRAAWVLLAGNILDNLGLGLFFPILPLFVEGRGGGPVLVGVIGASALLGNLLVQAPGGWLADRYNRRTIVILSMAAYGIFFLAYLVPLPVNTLIGIRFVHAAVGGFYMPAARALLADLTPTEMRANRLRPLAGVEHGRLPDRSDHRRRARAGEPEHGLCRLGAGPAWPVPRCSSRASDTSATERGGSQLASGHDSEIRNVTTHP